ncbi:response regulator [Thermanaerosceptrum fracticalcis]|uniref:Stage 0 sporulation protein A homolog n=1 Tax=Thermanaerosceptrum fracticalcis TaxID=1712410 RepID=A0A7G6DZT0_THEFR|nr:response regulator [Thermanaerosceptrum fracticalcis]
MVQLVYRVFFADDEPLICNELRYILEQEPDIEIVGECYAGSKVVGEIKKYKPHVVFLDINMPGSSGIEIASQLVQEPFPPLVIFVTAYEEYAIAAFKVNAIGYVLKPFTGEDIQKVLRQVRILLGRQVQYTDRLQKTLDILQNNKLKRIPAEKDGKIFLIDPEEIHVILVKNKITYIQTQHHEYISNQPLLHLEEKLIGSHFFRCHRNFLVNLKKVKEIIPWFHGTYLLVVYAKDKMEIPVSRYRVKDFKELVDL